jgi:twitching motility protein PilU
MSAMKRLFQLMAEKKASDIFMSVGAPINIKINGQAIPVNQHVMTPETITTLLYEVLTDKQKRELEETLDLNTAFPMEGVGSFRISAFRQKGGPAVVVRYIPGSVPPIDTLGVPTILKEVIMEKRGLILMVGATGSGKSTTLAAMLDYRNEQKAGHILTIEDPIEFIFQNKKCIVNQREVGSDTLDFRIALKNALRQAPDCILIGEVRDSETMKAAIQYAQSGHLCLATLHANNSYHALNRIISFYPLENRPALLEDLSATMKCIISQRLIRNAKGGRSPAVEVLLATRHIAELIGKGEINEIKEAMEKSLSPGSRTFEQAFFEMMTEGLITQDEAMANCDSPTNLIWLINNTEAGGALKAAQKQMNKDNPPPPPAAGGTGGTGTGGGASSFSEFKLDVSSV